MIELKPTIFIYINMNLSQKIYNYLKREETKDKKYRLIKFPSI